MNQRKCCTKGSGVVFVFLHLFFPSFLKALQLAYISQGRWDMSTTLLLHTCMLPAALLVLFPFCEICVLSPRLKELYNKNECYYMG